MTLLRAPYTATEVVMFFVAAVIYIASYQFFTRTATPKFGPKKEVLDPGLDLNMAEGMAEHVKDLVILTSGTQVLSLLSNYVWLLLLLAPGRAFMMAWRSVISPWLFAPAPENRNGRQETEENGPQN